MSNGDDVDQDSQPQLIRTFFGPTVGWRNVPETEIGEDNFLSLDDTPDSYVGQEGKLVTVNVGGTGLEFIDPPVVPPAPEGDTGWTNVLNFGAVGDGIADDAPAIQAAIDAAFAVSNPSVYVPSGQYNTASRPIFVDPPGNMRGADGVNGQTWNSGLTFGSIFGSPNITQNSTCNHNGIPYITLQVTNINHEPGAVGSETWWRPFNWDIATAYVTGDIVRHGGVPWIALSNNTGNDPLVIGSTFWRPWYTNPIRFNFSMRFFGAQGGNHEGAFSSRLNCGQANRRNTALFCGPGQGMIIEHLSLIKVGQGQANKAKFGYGIAVAGGPGGATRTTISNVWITHFEVGVFVGFNQDSLGDSNFLVRLAIFGCYIGVFIAQTQNFINSLLECSMANTINVKAQSGTGYNVYGGNYTGAIAPVKDFSLTAQTPLVGALGNRTYSATITNPNQVIDQGGYERFAIKTVNWGVIPFNLVSWVTPVITLVMDPIWEATHFGTLFPGSADLSNEVQACATLHSTEWARTFMGPAKVRGVHIENTPGSAVHTLLWLEVGFANDGQACLEDIFYNSSINHSAGTSEFYLQSVTPWIMNDSSGGAIRVKNVRQSLGAGRTQANIWQRQTGSGNSVHFEACDSLILCIPTHFSSPFKVTSDIDLNINVQATFPSGDTDENRDRHGFGTHPNYGYFPLPSCVPLISEETLAAWMANTQSFNGNHPPMMGGQIYQVETGGTQAQIAGIRSDHRFFTAGGTYAKTWRYHGGSRVVYLPTSNLRMGQVIILDNGITGPQLYLIEELHFIDGGYVYVTKVGTGGVPDFSVDGANYTAGTVGQQVPNVTYTFLEQTNTLADPASGFSHLLSNKDTKLIITGSGTLAAGTIQLCGQPRDRQTIEVRSGKTITNLTISATGGRALAPGVPTTLNAGSLITAMFNNATNTWYFGA